MEENNMQSYAPTAAHVRLLGRSWQDADGTLWLGQSASGVEFSCTAAQVSLTLAGDQAARPDNAGSYARFAVDVNGTRVLDTVLTGETQIVPILLGAACRPVTIRLIKLSEAASSIMGVRCITADAVPVPTAAKPRCIEFIGDSITCGYGVDARDETCAFSTETEDATKSCAFLAAAALDVDWSMVAYSGYGIWSGFTEDGQRHGDALVPPYYEKVAVSKDNPATAAQPWDFSRIRPALVVLNLGTNDTSYCGTDPARQAAFTAAYVAFLRTVRARNPEAYILCALGLMKQTMYACVEAAVARHRADTGDARISAFQMPLQDAADGYGADWHPSAVSQQKAAAVLTAQIRRVMAW